MIAPAIKCDVCGRECNCFLAFTRPGARGITFGLGTDRDLVPAQEDLVIEDLCGQKCAHDRLSTFLDSLQSTATERHTL
jgi:hypothetical protein